MLEQLFDRVVVIDGKPDVIDALRIIDPSISDISMIGGEILSSPRTALVRSDRFNRPVSLRSFGDGLNRLFAMVLSLINARGGVLLVDEFENSLHYSALLDAWRMIFRLAQALDVQVFATSHSWDTIETFQEAAAEGPEHAALLRLTQRGGDVIPTVFAKNELAIATRDKIEVR